MSRRLGFQSSRAVAFLESPALERNLESSRAVLRIGAGPGIIYSAVRERVVHSYLTPQHIHTKVVPDSVVLGPGFTNAATLAIPGSGWARVTLRVRGVACAIPTSVLSFTEGDAHLNRLGAVFSVGGTGVYSELQPKAAMSFLPDATSFGLPAAEYQYKAAAAVGLNFVEDEAEWSDTPRRFDRLVRFSAILPVNLSGVRMGGWSTLAPSGGFLHLYQGGTTTAEVTYTSGTFAGLVGTGIGNNPIAANPDGLNMPSLVAPYVPILTSPVNSVALEAQVVGWRPASGPARESYVDLLEE